MAKYGTFKYGQAKYGTGTPFWVTDRCESDIVNDTPKAYINYADLNRIETQTKKIFDLTSGLTAETKTDWTAITSTVSASNFPSETQCERIIGNIRTLCEHYGIDFGIKSMNNLTIYQMNEIEKTLYRLYLKTKESDVNA